MSNDNIKAGSVRVTIKELVEGYISKLTLGPGMKLVGANHLLDPVQGIVHIDLSLAQEDPANDPAE